MYVESRQFSHTRVFNAPDEGVTLEFGIGVRGPKCLNDGPTRWSEKFSDRFSRFDTIPVCDGHPASHPRCRSKDAICIAASRSKTGLGVRLPIDVLL